MQRDGPDQHHSWRLCVRVPYPIASLKTDHLRSGGFADVCTTTKMCLGNLACGVSPAGTTGQATCGGTSLSQSTRENDADGTVGVGASCTNDGITPVLANCAPGTSSPTAFCHLTEFLGLSCSSATLICVSTSTSTSVSNGVSPSLPVPSAKLRRRSLSSARRHLCPLGYSKCPVSAFSSNILSSAAHTGRNTFGHAPHGSVWKCLNTASSLESCGGCPSLDATSPFHHLRSSKQNATREGVDCTTLPGVQGVECINSKCVVEACEAGWKFAMDEGGVGSCSL